MTKTVQNLKNKKINITAVHNKLYSSRIWYL